MPPDDEVDDDTANDGGDGGPDGGGDDDDARVMSSLRRLLRLDAGDDTAGDDDADELVSAPSSRADEGTIGDHVRREVAKLRREEATEKRLTEVEQRQKAQERPPVKRSWLSRFMFGDDQ